MSKHSKKHHFSQVSVMDFAPIQETGNNILEMIDRIANLKNKDLESPEYKTLVSRIRTQAFCLQGILTDETLNSSDQAKRMINTLEAIASAKKTNNLVKNCLNEILPIINGEINIYDEIKYNPVIPSSNMTGVLFKSMNHIDNQMELAKNDPEEYKRQDKLGIHGNLLDREKILEKYEDHSDPEIMNGTNSELNDEALNLKNEKLAPEDTEMSEQSENKTEVENIEEAGDKENNETNEIPIDTDEKKNS